MKITTVSDNAALVYDSLWKFRVVSTGNCTPSYQMISNETGLSLGEIKQALQELKVSSYITIQWRENQSNAYRLLTKRSESAERIEPQVDEWPEIIH